jgi:excisionase family DNA binding protein
VGGPPRCSLPAVRLEPTLGQVLDAALAALAPAIAEQVAALLSEPSGDAPRSGSPWLTATEAADYLRAKPKRIYDLVSQSRLPGHKDGSRLLLHVDDLDAYLRAADTLLTPPVDLASQSRSRRGVRIENPGVNDAA